MFSLGWLTLFLEARARAAEVLAALPPPTPDEIGRNVPAAFQNLGPDWIFTRGKLLAVTETRREQMVYSAAGFDVARPFSEEYIIYDGAYGYRDHQGRARIHRMKRSQNERDFRDSRMFIILFDRRRPRRHHLFTFQGSRPR